MFQQDSTVGQYLRRQREDRKLSLETIARGTRIKQAFLQAIEDDAFQSIPAETYVRGFIRTYAKYIQSNPDQALDLYRGQVKLPQDPGRQKKNSAVNGSLKGAKERLFDFLTTLAGGTPAYSIGKSVLRHKD